VSWKRCSCVRWTASERRFCFIRNKLNNNNTNAFHIIIIIIISIIGIGKPTIIIICENVPNMFYLIVSAITIRHNILFGTLYQTMFGTRFVCSDLRFESFGQGPSTVASYNATAKHTTTAGKVVSFARTLKHIIIIWRQGKGESQQCIYAANRSLVITKTPPRTNYPCPFVRNALFV